MISAEQIRAAMFLLGWLLIITGVAMALLATVIAYRFFHQSSVAKYCMKIVGIVLCVVGFLLTSEIYRL